MEKIQIENFKKIKDDCELDLAPITFLTGTNNSGKSTIIKATLLLQDYLKSQDLFNLNFKGHFKKKHGISSSKDILNKLNKLDEKYNSTFKTENHSHKITLKTKYSPSTRIPLVYEKKSKLEIDKLQIIDKKYNSEFLLSKDTYDKRIWNYKYPINLLKGRKSTRSLSPEIYEKTKFQLDSLRFDLELITLEKKKKRIRIGQFVQETMKEILADFPDGLVSNLHNFVSLDKPIIDSSKFLNKWTSDFIDFLEGEVGEENKMDNCLMDPKVSKEIFGINFPMLIPITKNTPEEVIFDLCHDKNGNRRYYKEIFKSKGQFSFLLTNDWYERNRSKYIEWLKIIKYKSLNHYYQSENHEEHDTQRFYEEQKLKGQIKMLEDKLESMNIHRDSISEESSNIEYIEGSISSEEIDMQMRDHTITGCTTKSILIDVIKRNVVKNIRDEHKYLLSEKHDDTIKEIDKFFTSAFDYRLYHLSTNRYNGSRFQIGNKNQCELDNLLINKFVSGEFKRGFIEKWMASGKFDLGYSYTIEKVTENDIEIGNYVKIFKSKDKKDFEYLSDQGYGSGQIFTILYKIATILEENKYYLKSNKTSSLLLGGHRDITLIIEEPETNLHPKLQSKLAELFYKVNEKYGINFIIETHSEYLIRKSVSVSITNNLFGEPGEKLPNDFPFKLYYLSDGIPRDMKYLNGGGFKGQFDSGFFDESSRIQQDNILQSLK